MIRSWRTHAFRTALLILAVYLLVFLGLGIVIALSGQTPVASETTTSHVQNSLGQLPLQLGIATALLLVVMFLGWRREVGFHRVYPGGLKYVLIPLIVGILYLGTFILVSLSDGGRDVFLTGSLAAILGLILVNLLTGFTEELMFRGILFHGLRERLSPLWTVVVTALLFGSVHLLNLLSGAAVENTVPQVIYAAALGIALGAMRLRGGAIVPLMLYHGIWDFLVDDLSVAIASQAQGQAAGTAVAAGGGGISVDPIMLLPAVYGVFVLWRYYVARRKGKIPVDAAPEVKQNLTATSINE